MVHIMHVVIRVKDRHIHIREHINRHPLWKQHKDLRQENTHPDGNEILAEGGTVICVRARVCENMASSLALQLIDLSCMSLSFSICLSL